MNADFEKLASRASFAALAVAPPGGKEYELLYLEDSPDREACQALSSRGLGAGHCLRLDRGRRTPLRVRQINARLALGDG